MRRMWMYSAIKIDSYSVYYSHNLLLKNSLKMQLLYFCSFLDKKVYSQGERLSTVNIQNKFKSDLP